MLRWSSCCIVLLTLAGCASKFDYVPPAQVTQRPNSIEIEKPLDAVWSAAVPALSKEFFVINNLDKASGLINVSYSGDPEKYVDCGRVTSYVKNLRGERNYDIAGSAANANLEIMDGSTLYSVNRKMSLDGRINIVFEAISSDKTRVTVNTRYVLTRSSTVIAAGGGGSNTSQDAITFDSKNGASYPPNKKGVATQCVANGMLEQTILDIVKADGSRP